jgi:protein-L-isoaspartate(D-aspartate) O-methyltransferase
MSELTKQFRNGVNTVRLGLLVCGAALLVGPVVSCKETVLDPTQERLEMVNQIRDMGVTDEQVLTAMRSVPRHLFVPSESANFAYNDYPLPIDSGQTISEPYVVAYMTEALKLRPTDRVLEIGTGSGYQAAVLSKIVKKVYTVEIVKELATTAAKRLKELGFNNIEVRNGDGYAGWPEAAPFDAIIVTAAAAHIPRPLLDQLKPGSRLVIPVGRGEQLLLRVTRTADGFKQETLLPVIFVPMTGKVEQQQK